MLSSMRMPRRLSLAVGQLILAARPASTQSLSYVGGLQDATGDVIFTRELDLAWEWHAES